MCLRLFLCLCLCLFQFLCLYICLRLYLFLCVFLDLYVYACAHICILRSAFITRHCLTHFTQDSTRTKFFHKSEFAHPHLFSQLSPPDPPPSFEIHAEEFDLRTFLAQCEFARLYLCSHLFLPPSPPVFGTSHNRIRSARSVHCCRRYDWPHGPFQTGKTSEKSARCSMCCIN